MSPRVKLLAWAVFAIACSMSTANVAFAEKDVRTHVVQYQCGNEAPQSFSYAGGINSQYGPASLEAQWYWGRTRADHGAGCKVTQVDGQPY